MAGFQLTQTVRRPRPQVFAFATNPHKVKTVMPNITAFEQVTSGPVGLGTRFRETRLVRGQPSITELEVVAHVPSSLYGCAPPFPEWKCSTPIASRMTQRAPRYTWNVLSRVPASKPPWHLHPGTFTPLGVSAGPPSQSPAQAPQGARCPTPHASLPRPGGPPWGSWSVWPNQCR